MQKYVNLINLVDLVKRYLLAKIGVDTAENEPLEVWGKNSIQYSLQSLFAPHERLQGRPVDDVSGARRVGEGVPVVVFSRYVRFEALTFHVFKEASHVQRLHGPILHSVAIPQVRKQWSQVLHDYQRVVATHKQEIDIIA